LYTGTCLQNPTGLRSSQIVSSPCYGDAQPVHKESNTLASLPPWPGRRWSLIGFYGREKPLFGLLPPGWMCNCSKFPFPSCSAPALVRSAACELHCDPLFIEPNGRSDVQLQCQSTCDPPSAILCVYWRLDFSPSFAPFGVPDPLMFEAFLGNSSPASGTGRYLPVSIRASWSPDS